VTPLRAWRVSAGYTTAQDAQRALIATTRRIRLSLATYRKAESGTYRLREETLCRLARLFGAQDSLRLLTTLPDSFPAQDARSTFDSGLAGRRSQLRRKSPSARRRLQAQTKVGARPIFASTETK
jgi:hypothetical protein